jgi:hypothetical protein
MAVHKLSLQHFILRAWERYNLVLDTNIASQALEILKSQRETPDLHLVGRRSEPHRLHQQVWWMRVQQVWIRLVYDTERQHLVTALPPDDTLDYFTGQS